MIDFGRTSRDRDRSASHSSVSSSTSSSPPRGKSHKKKKRSQKRSARAASGFQEELKMFVRGTVQELMSSIVSACEGKIRSFEVEMIVLKNERLHNLENELKSLRNKLKLGSDTHNALAQRIDIVEVAMDEFEGRLRNIDQLSKTCNLKLDCDLDEEASVATIPLPASPKTPITQIAKDTPRKAHRTEESLERNASSPSGGAQLIRANPVARSEVSNSPRKPKNVSSKSGSLQAPSIARSISVPSFQASVVPSHVGLNALGTFAPETRVGMSCSFAGVAPMSRQRASSVGTTQAAHVSNCFSKVYDPPSNCFSKVYAPPFLNQPYCSTGRSKILR